MSVIRRDEAEYEDGVRCVVMPCCAFTFDAGHTDDVSGGETYTCPLCNDQGPVADRDALATMLKRLLDVALVDGYGETVRDEAEALLTATGGSRPSTPPK
jgi:hypothetical protein